MFPQKKLHLISQQMNKLQFQAEDSFNIQIVENKIEKKENIKSNRHKLKGRKKESKNKKKTQNHYSSSFLRQEIRHTLRP